MKNSLPGPYDRQKTPESTEITDEDINRYLNLVKKYIESGQLDPERLKSLCTPDTKPTERKLEGSVYGYDTVIKLGGEIISIKGPNKALYKGMLVETVGDSQGFVNGNLKPGQKVTIIEFIDPAKDTLCIKVAHNNGTEILKLKEVKPIH